MFKKVLIAAVAAGATLAAVSSANAEGGCGPGGHRGPYGGCRPNLVAGGPVIGGYYGPRGYWDGHRYWGHRYAWRGGWRYR